MSNPKKLYWDSSCFISLLNGDEPSRTDICKDILKNGELGNVTIFTSMWTIVEVVRPKRPGTEPLPEWAEAAITSIEEDHPQARQEMDMLWRRHQSDTTMPKLTQDQIDKIEGMFFGWPFLTLIRIDKQVSRRAVGLQRDYNLKAGDSIHVASALTVKDLDEMQAWDRDFGKVASKIKVGKPKYISPAGALYEGLDEHEQEESEITDGVRGSGENDAENEAGTADTPDEAGTEKTGEEKSEAASE